MGFMWIFWTGILIVVFFMARSYQTFSRDAEGTGDDNSALEIPNQRYARGEMGRGQYMAAKRDIQQ